MLRAEHLVRLSHHPVTFILGRLIVQLSCYQWWIDLDSGSSWRMYCLFNNAWHRLEREWFISMWKQRIKPSFLPPRRGTLTPLGSASLRWNIIRGREQIVATWLYRNVLPFKHGADKVTSKLTRLEMPRSGGNHVRPGNVRPVLIVVVSLENWKTDIEPFLPRLRIAPRVMPFHHRIPVVSSHLRDVVFAPAWLK